MAPPPEARRRPRPRVRFLGRALRHRVNMGVVIALGAVAGMGIVSYNAMEDMGTSFEAARGTQDVIALLRETFSAVQKLEGAQRGYVLTGSADELRSYEAAASALAGLGETLRRVEPTLEHPQRERIHVVDSLIGARREHARQVLSIYQSAGFEAARRLIETRRGAELTDQIGRWVEIMSLTEYDLLIARLRAAREHERESALVILLSTLLTMLLVLAGGYVINWDIALRQHAEKKARDAARDASAASEAKTHFLATVSHEIRTPLSAVGGMTELLMETRLSPEQMELARTIHANSESLSFLLRDLLDSSKIEAGQVDLEAIPFAPAETVETVADVLAIRAEMKGLTLVVAVDPELPSQVLGDPNRFRQVLMNLIDNAVKFTESGEVAVRAAAAEPARPGDEARIVVSVQDMGIGILPEQQQRIFDAFVQADRSTVRRFGGSGLGLSIARSLVGLMGGELTVESEPGKGSTFTFSIPFPVLAGPTSRQPEGAAALAGMRILIADHSHARSQAVSWPLESAGAQVEIVTSEAAALERLAAAPGFSLLMADESLADSSASALPLRLDERLGAKAPPIILFSSLQTLIPAAEDASRIIRVQKPVRGSRIVRQVREALGLEERRALPACGQQLANAGIVIASPRILLVEDQRDSRFLFTRLLADAGYAVDVAENGLVAVEKAGKWRYDLILMDIELPMLDGYQATAAIRTAERASRSSPVPIVALTAHAVAEFREEAIFLGMDDYVTKPVNKRQLLDVCARWADARPVVLIVDDAVEQHAVLASHLSDLPCRIISASNGLEAVNIFRRQRVSLVMLDMDMPVMDGYDAARTIRLLPGGAAVPIIATTGYEGADERERCIRAGCTDILQKPLRRDEVIRLVTSLLGPAMLRTRTNGEPGGETASQDTEGMARRGV